MSVVEQFPYCDRNPASPGLDLMPDVPILLRHQSQALSAVGLVDSGASISVLPYSLGLQLGFDWQSQTAPITLAGTLAHVDARGIVVEAARPDFTILLRNAALSISQAGYNTVIETLCCADRAVLVPFATERETEQADRAQVLAEHGMVAVVPPDTLSADSLAAGIRHALDGPSIRSFPPCDINGGAKPAALLHQLLAHV